MGFHTTVTFTLIRPSATFSLREKKVLERKC